MTDENLKTGTDLVFKLTLKNKLIFMTLFCLPVILLFSGIGVCEENKIIYRIPSVYNPNPVSGRLYLQPIGTHEDQILYGINAEIGLGSSTDYNIYFSETPDVVNERLTVNSNILTVKFSSGFHALGQALEFGTIVRSHQDQRETYISNFVKNYHEVMDFGNIPPDGQLYGAIGENKTGIIGDSGDIFLTTFQFYAKVQVLKDNGLDSFVPNLSFKTSFRLPASDYEFDGNGVSLSTGISKEISPQFVVFFAAGLIHQNTSKNDFNATNIRVKKRVYDMFTGFIWDIGKRGAWYISPGLRISSERISYIKNPDSADDSFCTHIGLSYRKVLRNGSIMEFFFNFNEDLPGLGYGLEPDVRVQSGLTINFRNRN